MLCHSIGKSNSKLTSVLAPMRIVGSGEAMLGCVLQMVWEDTRNPVLNIICGFGIYQRMSSIETSGSTCAQGLDIAPFFKILPSCFGGGVGTSHIT